MVGIGYALLVTLDHIAANIDYSMSSKILLHVLAMVYGASLGYSRLFLGLHSLD